MKSMTRIARWAGVIGVAASLGCKSLDVQNPNAPDAQRAFADPSAVAGLVSGAFKGWWNTHSEFNSALLLNHMADGMTSSWNNFNIRYYTSEGNECPVRCGWDNSPSSAFRFQIETYWYGYYAALSNANDVLTAIRKNNVVISDAPTTKMLEAAAVLMQGMVFSQIMLNYDQGFIVTEATDLSTPAAVAAVQFSTRAQLRDAAVTKLGEAATLFGSVTLAIPKDWFGKVQQPTYTAADMVRFARTMQAEALAYYPRNAAENAQVNWGQVASFAAQGLTGGSVDIGFYHDATDFYDGVKQWGNDITTVRVDTRVARLITDGPEGEALRHKDPWPDPNGNPQPDAFDKRVGNGTWGPDDDFLGVGTLAWDGGEGTDYAYAAKAIFRPARGQYHQSNLGSIRFSALAYVGYGLPTDDGKGFAPQYPRTVNDLLWAEALLRSGGSATQAATLINKTRVTRGGLPALTGGEDQATLLTALQYEQDIELLSYGANNFYNRRRIDGLKLGTPRVMPVPAKELQVLQKELYTCGGPNIGGGNGTCNNPSGAPGTDASMGRVRNVRDIWAEISDASKLEARRRNRH